MQFRRAYFLVGSFGANKIDNLFIKHIFVQQKTDKQREQIQPLHLPGLLGIRKSVFCAPKNRHQIPFQQCCSTTGLRSVSAKKRNGLHQKGANAHAKNNRTYMVTNMSTGPLLQRTGRRITRAKKNKTYIELRGAIKKTSAKRKNKL